MNLKLCSTSGSPNNQAFRVRSMCHCLSTLNQSIPATCWVFCVLLALFNSKAWNCLCCCINVKNSFIDLRQIYSSKFKVNLHDKFYKFTISFSRSMANWFFRSWSKFNSSLYARKVARNQFVQAFIVRLFSKGNQIFSNS